MEPARVIAGDAKSTEGKIWQVLIPRKGEGTAISIMDYIVCAIAKSTDEWFFKQFIQQYNKTSESLGLE